MMWPTASNTTIVSYVLARLICFLLGHVFDELVVLEGAQPPVYVSHSKCARCGARVVEVRDLRDEYDAPPTHDGEDG